MSDLISKKELLKEMEKFFGNQRSAISENVLNIVKNFPGPNGKKFLEFPCYVGDQLNVARFESVDCYAICSISIEESGVYLISEDNRPFCKLSDFGKTAFFEEEKAVAALSKMKGDAE